MRRTRLRPAHLALALAAALAGCFGGGPDAPGGGATTGPDPGPSASGSGTTTAAAAPPPQPARVRDAGFSWSSCSYFTSAFSFKHEWASVPPGYRMANTLAGNVGQVSVQIFDCAAVSVGNQTFLPGAAFGYAAILVEPPEGRGHPDGDFYLVGLFADNATLAGQLAEATAPAAQATLALGEEDQHLASAPLTMDATLLRSSPAMGNATATMRLHWVAGGQACWLDLHHAAVDLARGEVSAEFSGPWSGFSGPAQQLVGLGSLGEEAGTALAPVCVEA
jgi:hypothetical protein